MTTYASMNIPFKPLKFSGFLLVAVLLASIELVARFSGNEPLRLLAAWIWACLAAFSLSFLLIRGLWTLLSDLKQRYFWSSLSIGIVAFICLWKLGSPFYFINNETAAELTAGLEKLRNPDLGYFDVGFLGYPVRQYILASLPSAVFGPGLFVMRFGFASLYLLGAISLYSALCDMLRDRALKPDLAVLAVLGISTSQMVVFHIRDAEQTIIPISLTMLVISSFIRLQMSQSVPAALVLLWTSGMLATSYTPALASLSLLLSLLAIYALKTWRSNRGFLTILNLGCLIYVLAVGVSSLSFRQDIKLTAEQTRRGEWLDILLQQRDAFECFFFGHGLNEGMMFSSMILQLPLLFYLGWSVMGRLRLYDFLISIWAISTISLAVYMEGYAPSSAAHDLHRAMVIFPPLLTGMAVSLASSRFKQFLSGNRSSFAILFVILSCSSLWNLLHTHRDRHTHFQKENRLVFTSIAAIINSSQIKDQSFNLEIKAPRTDIGFEPLLRYFYPSIDGYRKDDGKCSVDLRSNKVTLVVFRKDQCPTVFDELRLKYEGEGSISVPADAGEYSSIVFLPFKREP